MDRRPTATVALALLLAATPSSATDSPSSHWNSAPAPPPQHSSPNAWVLVDRALQTTGGLARGVGDAITFGTGGVFRLTGNAVRSVGSGIEAVGDAVAGDSGSKGGDAPSGDPGGATRRLLSRPMRIVSGAVKSAGDGITMLGDATERLVSCACERGLES